MYKVKIGCNVKVSKYSSIQLLLIDNLFTFRHKIMNSLVSHSNKACGSLAGAAETRHVGVLVPLVLHTFPQSM